MKRLELFANQSIREEIVRSLEQQIGLRYSLIPAVHGRGGDDWKLGTTVWPEENFMVISYLDDSQAEVILQALELIKSRFPREGLVYFFMKAGK